MKKAVFRLASVIGVSLAVLAFGTAKVSAITDIGPFLGSLQEDFENPSIYPSSWVMVGGPNNSGPLTIMGGAATLHDQQLFIWRYGGAIAGSSGTAVAPHGNQGVGENVEQGTMTLEFTSAVARFGGYFQAFTYEQRPTPISFSFFDVFGDLLQTRTYDYLHANGDGLLDWHGWSFDTPVKKITWTETGGQSDWYQANPVPDGGLTAMLLGLGLGGVGLVSRKLRK